MEAEPPEPGPPSLPGHPARCRPPTATRSSAPPTCCARPSARRSWPAPASTGATASTRSSGSARSCAGARCSSTAWRVAACRRTTTATSRGARGTALKGADVALVIGVPMDFRLGFGGVVRRGHEARSCIGTAPPPTRIRARSTVELYGGLPATLDALREGAAGGPTAPAGSPSSARSRTSAAPASGRSCPTPRAPLHPMRVYGELQQVIDRDTIVIGDGGDFVSYAGRVIETHQPGCWMDPGPYGCLGTGPGYAIAAAVARPDQRTLLLLGDGAFGFSGPRVRHDGPPQPAGRRGDGQQRHLGAREAPDGVPLRLLGRGRAAARTCATTRWSRISAATASSSSAPRT